jgi:predicted DNA-binding transcriptional regulator AlpA
MGPPTPSEAHCAPGHPAILVIKDCITKLKKQPKVVQLPTCLRKLVSAEIIAESTGWSVKHVYRLAQQGLVPNYRIHGSVRFDPQKIADWLEAHRIAA